MSTIENSDISPQRCGGRGVRESLIKKLSEFCELGVSAVKRVSDH